MKRAFLFVLLCVLLLIPVSKAKGLTVTLDPVKSPVALGQNVTLSGSLDRSLGVVLVVAYTGSGSETVASGLSTDGRFCLSWTPKISGTYSLQASVDGAYSVPVSLTVGSGSASFNPFAPEWLLLIVLVVVLVVASLYHRKRDSCEFLSPESDLNDWSDV